MRDHNSFEPVRVFAPGADYLTSYTDWLARQSGAPWGPRVYDPNPRYMRNIRDLAAWVDAVGELRASPPQHRAAQRARLESVPLTLRAVAVEDAGAVVATGLTIVEDDCAGLFDIITREEARLRGHARTIVASLLQVAWELGARHAYLQVQADNDAARPLYRQFGFQERYVYWYRGRPGEMQ